uniref:PHD-type domain-containing protein n=1 Tax=Clytia hemisphaerica TaxID=252671 RepID=A0A7M5X010_9CNID
MFRLNSTYEDPLQRNSYALSLGFRTCGIVPVNANQILRKLPGANRDGGVLLHMDQSILQYLKQQFPENPPKVTLKRGKKVIPGADFAKQSSLAGTSAATTSSSTKSSSTTSPSTTSPSTTSSSTTSSSTTSSSTTSSSKCSTRGKEKKKKEPKVSQQHSPKSRAPKRFQSDEPSTSGYALRNRAEKSKKTDEEVETYCGHCFGEYIAGKYNWIACDNCDEWYHLQCSGYPYEDEDYWQIELDGVEFVCHLCN